MKTLHQLTDYLLDLQKARNEARAEGDWTRVDFIGVCIDEVREEIKKNYPLKATQ